jgi:hypothetical protein
MYPYPAADLAPPALPVALFGGVSKWPESAESIHVCGVDGPSPRIDLAPPQPLRTRGHFLRNSRAPPAPLAESAKGEPQQQKSNFGRRIAQSLLE